MFKKIKEALKKPKDVPKVDLTKAEKKEAEQVLKEVKLKISVI